MLTIHARNRDEAHTSTNPCANRRPEQHAPSFWIVRRRRLRGHRTDLYERYASFTHHYRFACRNDLASDANVNDVSARSEC